MKRALRFLAFFSLAIFVVGFFPVDTGARSFNESEERLLTDLNVARGEVGFKFGEEEFARAREGGPSSVEQTESSADHVGSPALWIIVAASIAMLIGFLLKWRNK